MGKKTKKEKEVARLRREVEVLKAQLSGRETTRSEEATLKAGKEKEENNPPQPQASEKFEIQRVDPRYIKADLLRAGILTVISLGAIAALYALRTQLPFL